MVLVSKNSVRLGDFDFDISLSNLKYTPHSRHFGPQTYLLINYNLPCKFMVQVVLFPLKSRK